MSIRSRIRGALSRAKKRAKAGAARTKAKSKASGKRFRSAVKKQFSRASKASSKRQAARAKTTQAKRQRTKAAATKYVASVKEQTKKSVERRVQRDIKAGVSEKKARRRQEIRTEFAKGAAVGASFVVPAGAAVRAIGATTRGAKVVRAVSGKQVRTLATAGYLGAEGYGVYAAEDKVKQTAGAAGRIFGAGGVFSAARGGIKRTTSTIGTKVKRKGKPYRTTDIFGRQKSFDQLIKDKAYRQDLQKTLRSIYGKRPPQVVVKREGLTTTIKRGYVDTKKGDDIYREIVKIEADPVKVFKGSRGIEAAERVEVKRLRDYGKNYLYDSKFIEVDPLPLPKLTRNYRGGTKGAPKRPPIGGGRVDISGKAVSSEDFLTDILRGKKKGTALGKEFKVAKVGKGFAIVPSSYKPTAKKVQRIPEVYKVTKDKPPKKPKSTKKPKKEPDFINVYETRRVRTRDGRVGTISVSKSVPRTKAIQKPKTRQRVRQILDEVQIKKTKPRPKTKTKTITKQKLKKGVLVGLPQFEKAGAVTITKMDSLLKYKPDIIPVPPIGKTRTTIKRPPIIPPFKFGGGGGVSRRPRRILGEEQAGRFTRSFTAQVLGLKAPKKRKVKRKYTGFELRI